MFHPRNWYSVVADKDVAKYGFVELDNLLQVADNQNAEGIGQHFSVQEREAIVLDWTAFKLTVIDPEDPVTLRPAEYFCEFFKINFIAGNLSSSKSSLCSSSFSVFQQLLSSVCFHF